MNNKSSRTWRIAWLMMYFPPQCLGRWRPLWENIWINDRDWWDKPQRKKIHVVHFTHTDVPPSCTAPQHQTFRLAHSITVEDVFFLSTQGAAKKKSNNNLLAELFLLPGASFQRRPGIGVMRVRLWDSWEHIIVCPVNWLYFVPSFPELGSTGRKRSLSPRGTFFPWIRRSSDESRVTALSLTSRLRRFSQNGGGGDWCTSVSQQTYT